MTTTDYKISFLERLPSGSRLHIVHVFGAATKAEAIKRAVDGRKGEGVKVEEME